MPKPAVEAETGNLFGSLFPRYGIEEYRSSVDNFARRLKANNFPLGWFDGKRCLDAGCGGGRYTIALTLLGADRAIGVDISRAAITDGAMRVREAKVDSVSFAEGSVLDLPFPAASFDCVVSSGVLHHTRDPERGVAEAARVLKPGGMLYMLLYATGGLRWPLVQMLRPFAREVGIDVIDTAVAAAGLPPAKRRTYLDDLFVPLIDFFSWDTLTRILTRHGFHDIHRWSAGRFDHEEDLDAYRDDLDGFVAIFDASDDRRLRPAAELCRAARDAVADAIDQVRCGVVTEATAMEAVIGQGHHRVVAWL